MGEKQPKRDLDERVSIPLDPETAMRGLLEVAPEPGEATEGESSEERESQGEDREGA